MIRIRSSHGFFTFEETFAGEIAHFGAFSGLDLVPFENSFTFDSLADAQKYSIKGGAYLDAVAIKTFEGEYGDVFRENSLVYDFVNDAVVPIETITTLFQITPVQYYFISDGLIQPGSIAVDGRRVTDFIGWFSFETMRFKYSEVSYV